MDTYSAEVRTEAAERREKITAEIGARVGINEQTIERLCALSTQKSAPMSCWARSLRRGSAIGNRI